MLGAGTATFEIKKVLLLGEWLKNLRVALYDCPVDFYTKTRSGDTTYYSIWNIRGSTVSQTSQINGSIPSGIDASTTLGGLDVIHVLSLG